MQMSGGVSQASPPLFLFGSQNFEEWLIPFIYEKNGKAQFEQDCMNFDGEKDLSLLLKLGFQRVLSNPHGPVSFTDEIDFCNTFENLERVSMLGSSNDGEICARTAEVDAKMSRVFSGCYNYGPYELSIPVLLTIATNKHLKKPPLGKFNGYNSRPLLQSEVEKYKRDFQSNYLGHGQETMALMPIIPMAELMLLIDPGVCVSVFFACVCMQVY